MQRLISRQGLYLLINSVVLIIALFRIPYLFNRPAPPFYTELTEGALVITGIREQNACPEIIIGDRVLRWENLDLTRPVDIEFLSELGEIGDLVNITIERDTIVSEIPIHLVPYYPSPRNIIVILFVGLITWIFGVIILIYGPDTTAKTVLYWTITALGLSVMLTTGSLDQTKLPTYLSELFFHIFYALTIGGFLYFSILFPRPITKHRLITGSLIFIPLLILTTGLIWYRFNAIIHLSLGDLAVFARLFDIFHLMIFVCIGGGILLFALSYRKADPSGEQLQVRWILWGVLIGSFPFLFLNILPQFFGITEFVAEEYTIIFFLVIPFSFTMAIVRYRLLDIDILISRTLVYAILTFFIGSAYFLVLFLIISAIGSEPVFEKYFSVLALTLLVTLFFNPLRVRVQRLVDNYLFTARGQYRNAVLKINRELGSVYNTSALIDKLLAWLAEYIPADNFAFYIYGNSTLELAGARTRPDRRKITLSADDANELVTDVRIFARPGLVPAATTALPQVVIKLMNDLNFSILMPVMTDNSGLYGLLACNPHLQKDHFIDEEVDLLLTAVSQLSQNLKRILLQESIMLEREEKKRLEAINKLMSFYVSSVSHELKSPLSAILLHTELLGSKAKISRDQKDMHLGIIKGEGERLQRLIDNILDISKIERGVRSYNFTRTDVNQNIEQVLMVMDYQISLNGVQLERDLSADLPFIMGDPDALQQALINLIDNAIKYSSEEDRMIRIRSEYTNGSVAIYVSDNGIGIPHADVARIFTRFYRGSDTKVHSIGGAGIGLTIVRHIVDAHKGEIRITSTPGKGSTFAILLPPMVEKSPPGPR